MQKYNKERPIIYHNCQCYRKDTPELVAFDPDRACPQGFLFRRKVLGHDLSLQAKGSTPRSPRAMPSVCMGRRRGHALY